MEKKTKKLIILLTVIFLACGAALAGLYVWKNANSGEQTAEDMGNDSNKVTSTAVIDVLDENGLPLDGSDITEVKTATDEQTLRALLKEEGKFAIELTKNIRIDEGFQVNGIKRLTGNKAITMELYAEPYQAICHVQTGAAFILDGVTLDGNAIANGVRVDKDAGFTSLSGKILYPGPYGVIAEGTVRIVDIDINKSVDAGICVAYGSKVYMEGGTITGCTKAGLYIAEGASAQISGNTKLSNNYICINNLGTCDISGGVMSDAWRSFVWNLGELSIDYKGTAENDRLEWYNCGESGVRAGKGSTTYINGLYVHDTVQVAVRGINHEGMIVENCLFENAGTYGFESANGKKDVTLTNIEVKNSKSSGIRVYGENKIEITDATITDAQGRGIQNGNATLIAENVKIVNSKLSGIYGGKGSTTQVKDVEIISSQRYGVENYGGNMTVKNATITDAALSGVMCRKETVTDLSNITIVRPQKRGIYNWGGTVTADTITIESPGQYGVSSSPEDGHTGKMTVSNLVVNNVAKGTGLICNGSVATANKITISNVSEYGARVIGGGTLTITDATIKECGMRGIGASNDKSVLNVTNANVENTGMSGIFVGKGATANLNTITMKKLGMTSGTETTYTASYRSGLGATAGTIHAKNVTVLETVGSGLYVNGGTLTAENVVVGNAGENGAYFSSSATYGEAKVDISGLEINLPGNRGVYNEGATVTLANVQVTNPKTYGITTAALAKTNYTGTLSVTGLRIIDVEKNNALNCNNSEMSVENAVISDVAEHGARVRDGGKLTLKGAEISDCGARGITADGEGTELSVSQTDVKNTGFSGVFVSSGADSEKKASATLTDVTITKAGFRAGADTEEYADTPSYRSGLGTTGASITASKVTVKEATGSGLYVNGGTIEEGSEKVVIIDAGADGVYASKSKTYGEANVTIDGLTITKTENNTTMNRGVYSSLATISLDSVAVSNVEIGVYVDGGTTTICGGTISDTSNRGVYITTKNHGLATAKIENVTIADATTRGVYNEGGNVTLNSVTVTSPGEYGVTSGKASYTEGDTTTTYTGKIVATNLTVTGVKQYNALHCNGSSIEVAGGTLSNITKYAAQVVGNGQLSLNNMTISQCGNGAISVLKGTAAMTGGTITDTIGYDVDLQEPNGTASVTLTGVSITRAEGNTHGSMNVARGKKQDGEEYSGTTTLTLDNCNLTGSGTATTESAITVTKGTLNIQNGGIYTNNVSGVSGGVIYVASTGNVNINQGVTKTLVSFDNNRCESSGSVSGGVINVQNGGIFKADTCSFTNNRIICSSSSKCFGGVFSVNNEADGNVVIKNTTFDGNKIEATNGYGGAISVGSGHYLTMENCVFGKTTENVASYGKDVRGANGTVFNLSGKIIAEFYNTTNLHKLHITGALDSESEIVMKWQDISKVAEKIVITFASADIVSNNKNYISLHTDHQEDWYLVYSAKSKLAKVRAISDN